MTALTLETLLALEHDGWKALCSARGGRFYGELMTAEAVMVLVNGMILDRDAVAASLDEAPPWAEFELTEPRLVRISDDAAALVYRARAARDGDGDGEPFTALMTSVYVLRDGRPRLALYQQTTVTR